MRLRDYLTKHNIQQAEFAAMVGTTPATVNRICQGLTVPRRALMAKIIDATNEEVTGQDLLILPKPTKSDEKGD